jgi:transposase
MAKMGRPRKEIDRLQFERLCGIQCTEEEIAGIFDCSVDTIENWCKRTYKTTFSEVYKIYSASGKASLRRTQFKLAERSAAMAIFLGKQYLGQKDTVEYEDKEAIARLDAILHGIVDQAKSEAE